MLWRIEVSHAEVAASGGILCTVAASSPLTVRTGRNNTIVVAILESRIAFTVGMGVTVRMGVVIGRGMGME